MTDEEHEDAEAEGAELLPPREVMSLLNTNPSAYAGLLGDPSAVPAGTGDTAGTADPTAGPTDVAGSAAGSAQSLADAHQSSSDGATISDQPQTITTDSTETASSET